MPGVVAALRIMQIELNERERDILYNALKCWLVQNRIVSDAGLDLLSKLAPAEDDSKLPHTRLGPGGDYVRDKYD